MGKSSLAQVLTIALLLGSCINEGSYKKYLAAPDGTQDWTTLDGTGEISISDMRLPDIDVAVDGRALPDVMDVQEVDAVDVYVDVGVEIDVEPDYVDLVDEEASCIPNCEELERECGDDGCGGSCGECNDGFSCNGLEGCNSDTGKCDEVEAPAACDDANPCTEDSCEPGAEEPEIGTGCLYSLLEDGMAPAGECEDQNPCTYDNCLAGECDNPVKPLEELGNDIDLCVCGSDEDCLPLDDLVRCNGTLACLAAPEPSEEDPDLMICQVDPATVPDCAALDGLFCNGQEVCTECPECDSEYLCQAGAPPVLEDSIACTVDDCDEELDEVVHTLTDALCEDDNVCTSDTCDPTAEGADGESGCLYIAAEPPVDEESISCIPDNPCQVFGVCVEMECDGQSLADLTTDEHEDGCNDGSVCTVDSCVAEEDLPVCSHVAVEEVTECDDGNPCTVGDECAEMLCISGLPVVCDDDDACTVDSCDLLTGDCGFAPVDIDDGDPCTADGCDLVSGEITHSPVSFDDDLYCNGVESCNPETGEKLAGVAPALDDLVGCTVDLCDEENDVVTHLPDDELCSDQTYCNGVESCDADQGCLDGSPVVCDDEVECTEDSCFEEENGCLFEVNDTLCADAVECTINEVCESKDGCELDLDHELCDDGNDCTDDVCDPLDGCLNTPVEDGLECVVDDPCIINSTCQGAVCAGVFDVQNCGDFDHDGLVGDEDLCPYAFDPGNPATNGVVGIDACEELSAHGTFSYQRALILSQEGTTSQWRRTHEPVEVPLANGIIDDSVVGYWKLDGDAEDFTGQFDGTNSASVPAPDRFGNSESAMAFEAENQPFIDIDEAAVAATDDPDAGLTVSFWFKADEFAAPDDDAGVMVYFGRGTSSGVEVVTLQLTKTGQLYAGLRNATGTPVGAAVDMEDTEGWHHVALSFDNQSDEARVYLDARLETSFACDSIHQAVYGSVGAARMSKYPDGVHFFDGSIDDLLVFKRALTPVEIETYYRSDAPYGTRFVPGSQADFDDVRVTEVGDDGKEFVKRSRVIGPRPHSDTPCPMAEDDGTWADRDDLCGVEAYWRLDGDATDELGNSNGVGTDLSAAMGRFGEVDAGLEFNGTSSYVDTGYILAPDASTSFTVEAWVRLDAPNDGAGDHVFGYWGDTGGKYGTMKLILHSSKVSAVLREDSNDVSVHIYADAVIRAKDWHHFAVQKDGDSKKWKVYMDGLLLASMDDSSEGNNNGESLKFFIGAVHALAGNVPHGHLDGAVDEVIIHNVIKSPDYIYHRANPGVPKLRFLGNTQFTNAGTDEDPAYPLRDYNLHWGDAAAKVVAPLVKSIDEQETCYGLLSRCMGYAGWWRFNEGSGDVAADSSTYANSGQLGGDTTWAAGLEGTGVVFDGEYDFVEIAGVETVGPDPGATQEASFFPDMIDQADNNYILSKHQSYNCYLNATDGAAGNMAYEFYTSDDYCRVGGKVNGAGEVPPVGSWSTVAATQDGAQGISYFDHKVDSTKNCAGSVTANGNSLLIGYYDKADNNGGFVGIVDSIRIMNRALEPDEFLHFPLVDWGMTTLLGSDGKPLDSDGDGIFDDGDDSGIIGDHPCAGGETEDCDDNAVGEENADQADDDADGVGQLIDNCPDDANPDQADADADGLGDGCDDEFTDLDHDGFLEGDLCPYSFDPGNYDGNGVVGPDGCEKLSQHGTFKYRRDLTLSQEGTTSQWRRTHEPVEIPLANGIVDDSVVGYWKFDGDVLDHGPASRQSTLTGSASYPEGLYGSALKLAGNTSAVTVASEDSEYLTRFSALGWVYASSADTESSLVTKNKENGGFEYDLYLSISVAKKFRGQLWLNGDWVIVESAPIDDATRWRHLALSYDGSHLVLYVDGKMVASQAATPSPVPTAPAPKLIIGNHEEYTYASKGLMDEVIVFNRALSPDEIETYYRSNAPYGTKFVPGAQADFDDMRVTELGDDGKEFVKRSRVIGPRPHSDTTCPMAQDDGTWADRDDLCGVVGYWKMDGDATDDVAGQAGVNKGAFGIGVFGDADGAASFAGHPTEEWADVTGSAVNSTEWSVESWFKSESDSIGNGAYQIIWDFRDKDSCASTDSVQAQLFQKDEPIIRVLKWCGFDKVTVMQCPAPVQAHMWHHLSVVRDDSDVEVYLDGLPLDCSFEHDQCSESLASPILENGGRLGGHCAGVSEMTFKGKVDEVLVHHVAKSPDYIYHRANPGVPKLRFLGNTQFTNAGTDEDPAYPLRDYNLHWGDAAAKVVAPLVKSIDQQETCYGLLSGCMGYAGWWRFNEGSGSVAVDSSGNKNNGSVMGPLSWKAGAEGTCLEFTGSADRYVQIADHPSLDPATGISMETMLQPESSTGANMYFLDKTKAYVGYLLASNGALNFEMQADTNCAPGMSPNGSSPAPKIWSHAAAAYGGINASSLLNFALDDSVGCGGEMPANPNDLFLGIYRYEWGELAGPFKGLIDSVRIMNRALEPDELLHFPLADWEMGAAVCGDGWKAWTEECDDGNEVDGDGCSSLCLGEALWTDPSSGLTWQTKPVNYEQKWSVAKQYCSALVLGGYHDWRMPDIGELRSLIRGCEATESDGPCNVGDGDCLQWSCRDDLCNGCELMEGPAPNGCYWPNDMTGSCDWYWSSSATEDNANYAWNVNFAHGYLGKANMPNGLTGPVLCVR